MVRLKGSMLKYGSPEDTFQFLVVRLKVTGMQAVYDTLVFQFLVVRLKVAILTIICTIIFISIPCGSIKSCPLIAFVIINSNFNSLWFD